MQVKPAVDLISIFIQEGDLQNVCAKMADDLTADLLNLRWHKICFQH
jgi:hypothetical protein